MRTLEKMAESLGDHGGSRPKGPLIHPAVEFNYQIDRQGGANLTKSTFEVAGSAGHGENI